MAKVQLGVRVSRSTRDASQAAAAAAGLSFNQWVQDALEAALNGHPSSQEGATPAISPAGADADRERGSHANKGRAAPATAPSREHSDPDVAAGDHDEHGSCPECAGQLQLADDIAPGVEGQWLVCEDCSYSRPADG